MFMRRSFSVFGASRLAFGSDGVRRGSVAHAEPKSANATIREAISRVAALAAWGFCVTYVSEWSCKAYEAAAEVCTSLKV